MVKSGGKILIRFFAATACALSIAGASLAQALTPLSPHPAEIAWPTQGWTPAPLAPEAAAVVTPLVENAVARTKSDVMGETRAVVIIHQGRLVMERYAPGFTEDTKQISWSMAKSVTSALVGRAVETGLIETLDAPMPTPFPKDDPRANIHWRHWLNMSDGLDYTEIGATGLANNDVVQMMFGRGRYDVLSYIKREAPVIHAPGTHWNYSSAGYHLIGNALQSVSGAGKDRAKMRDWMRAKLFTPLGMDAVPEFDPAATYLGGSLVWASARDFAKFGYLYLRDGVWNGERLLPKGWVDFSREWTDGKNCNVYGAGFWVTAYGAPLTHTQNAATPPYDAFHAGGHEGQTIWIVPSKDLVIVRLGLMANEDRNWNALYEWNQEIARAFPEAQP